MAPNELELLALKTEFELYIGFVKRLVLDLPNADDRTRAALWLQKLRAIKNPDQLKLRNEHLKLFLFALHQRAMVGIFEKKPPKEDLETFHDGLTLLEMTRELIEITEKKKFEMESGEKGACPLPPVRTNFSHDLKEYAACQEIPKFGAHVFYAVSKDPIQLWTKPADNNYPDRAAIPNQFDWEIALAKVSDHVLETQAAIDAALAAEKEKETGFIFDDGEEKEEEEDKKLDIAKCPGRPLFKWELNSPLALYQNFDFSDVGKADDLEEQGRHQLELDESALAVLDDSLPGRQRVHIRTPFFEDLPPDLSERRYHGVIEDIPEYEDESCEGPPCEDEDDEEGGGGAYGGGGGGLDRPSQANNRNNQGNNGNQLCNSCPCSSPRSSQTNYSSYAPPGGGFQSFSQQNTRPMTPRPSQQNYNMGNNMPPNYTQQYSSQQQNSFPWSNTGSSPPQCLPQQRSPNQYNQWPSQNQVQQQYVAQGQPQMYQQQMQQSLPSNTSYNNGTGAGGGGRQPCCQNNRNGNRNQGAQQNGTMQQRC